ncbi:MAG: hypothetical protein ACLQUW_11210 [Desulfobaccales bacterium]
MTSRQKSGKWAEGRPSRFGFHLSLFAFLPYLLLPLAYFVHLSNFSLLAECGDLKTAPPIIAGRTGNPVSHHDSNACPLCRGASGFQDYGASLAFHAPDRSSPVGLLGDGYCFSGRAKADAVTA